MRLAAVLLAEGLAAIDGGAARDGDAVLEEHAVELAALGHARHVGQYPEIHVGFADRIGMPPAGRMAAGKAKKGAETQFPWNFGHGDTVTQMNKQEPRQPETTAACPQLF